MSTVAQTADRLHDKPLPPGPGPRELLAALPRMLKSPPLFCRDLIARYGGIVRVNLGLDTIYLVAQPDYVEYVLKDRSEHFGKSGKLWAPVRLLMGNGLATSEGELWLKQRRLMQPQFGRQRLGDLCTIMATAIQEELNGWQVQAQGAPINLTAQITHLSMRIFLRTIFNTDADRAESREAERAIDTLVSHLHFLIWGSLLPRWVTLPGAKRWNEALRVLDRYVFSTIEKRRRDGSRAAGRIEDLLTLLINVCDESGQGMSDQQLRDEVTTLIIAGYENTATTITWCLYQLFQRPDSERRIREELDEVLGSRLPSFEDVARLGYTKLFISETLRFHSTLWLMLRHATAEEEIGGFRIPADSMIVIPIDAIHHNPRVWKDPEEFRPERFLPAESAGRSRGAFLPFGLGPHQCIGNNFALIQATLTLAMLLQRYRIKPVGSRKIENLPRIIQKPSRDLFAQVEPR